MELIYQAGLDSPALKPTTDTIPLKALKPIQAPDLPGTAAMEILDPPGLRFTLRRTRDPGDTGSGGDKHDDCYVGAVVEQFPDDIPYFKVRATFELPEWKGRRTGLYQWAMVVFARYGAAGYFPARKERATVTLQSYKISLQPEDESGNLDLLRARMNTPGGMSNVTAEPIPQSLYEGIFQSGDPNRSTFTIELLVDLKAKTATAGLDAIRYDRRARIPYRERREFTHPLISGVTVDPITGVLETIDSVGFAIAIGDEHGTASVTVRDFSIYRLDYAEMWSAKLAAWVAKLLPF